MDTGMEQAAEVETEMSTNHFFHMQNICKDYLMGEEVSHILKNVNLSIEEGEYLSVLGPSGSGKSTLMNIIGCLDVPTSGNYILQGRTVEDLTSGELADLRSREIGFIFQNSQLLPRLTAIRNVRRSAAARCHSKSAGRQSQHPPGR